MENLKITHTLFLQEVTVPVRVAKFHFVFGKHLIIEGELGGTEPKAVCRVRRCVKVAGGRREGAARGNEDQKGGKREEEGERKGGER